MLFGQLHQNLLHTLPHRMRYRSLAARADYIIRKKRNNTSSDVGKMTRLVLLLNSITVNTYAIPG
jgi:hypothetical protein